MNKVCLKAVCLSLLLFLSSQIMFSQENYIPGWVISLNGDTIRGKIDYQYWIVNPISIKFQKDNKGPIVKYNPLEIKKFSVYGEIYLSAIVQSEIGIVNSFESLSEVKTKSDTTFLQTIIEGPKSLYFYKNSDKKDQFYIKEDGKIELLIYKNYYKKSGGNTELVENSKYKGQLSFYLKEMPTVSSLIKKATYTKEGFTELFKAYYSTDPTKIEFQNFGESADLIRKQDTHLLKPEYGILAGMSRSSISFDGSSPIYLVDRKFDASNDFTAGLFLDVIFKYKLQRLSIYNELLYSSYQVSSAYQDHPDANFHTLTNFDLGYSFIRTTNMIRYKLPVGNSFIFGNIGFTLGFVVSETNYFKQEKVYAGVPTITEGKLFSNTNSIEGGLSLGIGAKYKKFSLETRFENGGGMYKSSNLNSGTSKLYFLMGYRF